MNARSLRNKYTAFVDLLIDSTADLFAVTETWLTSEDSTALAELSVPGYKLLHCQRKNRRGGGTALFFKNFFDVEMVDSAEKSSLEYSEWLVTAPTVHLRINIIYRPPGSDTMSTFLSDFADLLESVVLCNERLIICGDFNMHVNVSTDADVVKFSDLLESMSLVQHVEDSTHGILWI